MSAERIFLLSPAQCGGRRAQFLFNDQATFTLARRIRTPAGAPLGEVFAFLSGLYFRGKLAYSRAFGRGWVITSSRGLLSPDTALNVEDLRELAQTAIDPDDPAYRRPLVRDVQQLLESAGPMCPFVLLGSIATDKYVEPLRQVLADRLHVPAEFAGRGDMSRGALMLRCVQSGRELTYRSLSTAPRHGRRPPRLAPNHP